ncbi:hypothetical protein BrE312_2538 [Brenneria sp. EniD312]|nr:hypothetical protein BrE312_2538 [Brenneria sp. EniD312]
MQGVPLQSFPPRMNDGFDDLKTPVLAGVSVFTFGE